MGDAGRLKQQIRRAGEGLGFDQVGFAPADAPLHAAEFQDWLAQGYHGKMAYLAREDAVRRRIDPREALPGCRTIIMTTLFYGAAPHGWAGAGSSAVVETAEEPDRQRADGAAPPVRPAVGGSGETAEGSDRQRTGGTALRPGPGRRLPVVARYAFGRDYHHIFEDRLGRLADAIEQLRPGTRARRYVDYGPVLERDHAQRAGLGWIGKNTMLINPDLGSYFMIGELLTDLDIQPDEPFVHDRCGSCRRCIDRCPTNAIIEGRRLDARLCISYLTIELKGSIPEPLRPAIGTRVFGCDICQEVCPWNAGVPSPARHPFAPRPGQPVPPGDMAAWADEVAGMGEEEFRNRYRETAFSRPGRDGVLRNLAVGLGNAGGTAARQALERLARDTSALVREHARWGLARMELAAP